MKTVKAVSLGLVFLALGKLNVHAGEPVWYQSFPDSSYTVSNSTIAISSNTVQTIAAVQYYRQVVIDNSYAAGTNSSPANLYFTIDGTSGAAAIKNIGQVVSTNTIRTIETNGTINMVGQDGQTNKDVRFQIKRKSR